MLIVIAQARDSCLLLKNTLWDVSPSKDVCGGLRVSNATRLDDTIHSLFFAKIAIRKRRALRSQASRSSASRPPLNCPWCQLSRALHAACLYSGYLQWQLILMHNEFQEQSGNLAELVERFFFLLLLLFFQWLCLCKRTSIFMMKFLSGSYFWISGVFRKYLSLLGTRSQNSTCAFSIKSADCNKTVFPTQNICGQKKHFKIQHRSVSWR